MAEAASSQRILLKMLECSVCLLVYNNTNRLPKALRCLHTFCDPCISNLTKGTTIQCPKCRESCNAADVRTNYSTTDVLDALCEACYTVEREILCHHCNRYVCKSCHQKHCSSFYEELTEDVKSLLEKIDGAVALSNDTTKIKAQRTKSTDELQKMKKSIQNQRDFLDQKELEIEEAILKLRDNNIKVVMDWRQELDKHVTDCKNVADEAETKLGQELSNRITDEDMKKLKVHVTEVSDKLDELTDRVVPEIPYNFIEPKEVVIDVGQVVTGQSLVASPPPVIDVGQVATGQSLVASPPPVIDYTNIKVKSVTGQRGSRTGDFNGPWGVAVSHSGHVVVADCYNHRIKIYNNEMKLITTAGNDGHLQLPIGVQINHNNEIFVSSHDKHKICVYSLEGRFIRSFGTQGSGQDQFDHPYDICFSTDNKILYVCDNGNKRIRAVTPDGNHSHTFSTANTAGPFKGTPYIILYTQDNRILVSSWNDELVAVFNSNGDFVELLPKSWPSSVGNVQPRGLAQDQAGNILVADRNGCILVLNNKREYVCSIGAKGSEPGNFMDPFGIAVRNNGDLIVSEYGNHRIQILSPTIK